MKCKLKPCLDFTLFQSECLSSRMQTTTNVGKNTEKRNPCTLLVGMQSSTTTIESNMEIPHKDIGRTAIRSSDTAPGHVYKGT
jgi:hypothetical protein